MIDPCPMLVYDVVNCDLRHKDFLHVANDLFANHYNGELLSELHETTAGAALENKETDKKNCDLTAAAFDDDLIGITTRFWEAINLLYP